MAEELQAPATGSPLASQAPQASSSVSPSQPSYGADSRLAAILQKQANGETLTAADRGYLGSVKRRSKAKVVAPAQTENILLEPEPTATASQPPASAPADNILFEDGGGSQIPPQAPVAASVDSALLRRTADALLTSLDFTTKLAITYKAKAAGCDAESVDEWKAAVHLQPENRSLMVDNSEPVVIWLCDLFKCSPEKLVDTVKKSGFAGGFLAHGLGVMSAVRTLNERQLEREKQKAARE